MIGVVRIAGNQESCTGNRLSEWSWMPVPEGDAPVSYPVRDTRSLPEDAPRAVVNGLIDRFESWGRSGPPRNNKRMDYTLRQSSERKGGQVPDHKTSAGRVARPGRKSAGESPPSPVSSAFDERRHRTLERPGPERSARGRPAAAAGGRPRSLERGRGTDGTGGLPRHCASRSSSCLTPHRDMSRCKPLVLWSSTSPDFA